MTLEEVYQYCANVEYCLTIENLDLIAKEDLRKMIDYIYNESIPKEKVREKIKEYVNRRKELADCHFWENGSNINEDTALVIAIETLRHLGE